jgi:hypothetical protein
MRGQVDIDADTDTGTHRSPAVISAAASPRYPCRRPFVAGNPCPAVIIVVIPAAVVERSPTPRIIGNPSVSVIGHRPVTIRGIRMKTARHTRNPNVSVIVVFYPCPVRIQIIVKGLETDGTVVVIRPRISAVVERHAGRKRKHQRCNNECMLNCFHNCKFLKVYELLYFVNMTKNSRKGLTFRKKHCNFLMVIHSL